MRSLPIVPRPPIFILPKRKNGTDSVVMVRGTTSRMTITFSGSFGISLEVILEVYRGSCFDGGDGQKEGYESFVGDAREVMTQSQGDSLSHETTKSRLAVSSR